MIDAFSNQRIIFKINLSSYTRIRNRSRKYDIRSIILLKLFCILRLLFNNNFFFFVLKVTSALSLKHRFVKIEIMLAWVLSFKKKSNNILTFSCMLEVSKIIVHENMTFARSFCSNFFVFYVYCSTTKIWQSNLLHSKIIIMRCIILFENKRLIRKIEIVQFEIKNDDFQSTIDSSIMSFINNINVDMIIESRQTRFLKSFRCIDDIDHEFCEKYDWRVFKSTNNIWDKFIEMYTHS